MPTGSFCTECGAALTTDVKFCGECGHRLGTQALPPITVPAAVASKPASKPAPPPPPPAAANGSGAVPAHTVVQTQPAPPPHVPPPPGRRGRNGAVLAAAAVLVLAAGALVVVLLSGGDSPAADTKAVAYEKRVAAVFGPVLGANETLSNELQNIDGTRPVEAREAAGAALEATTAARGALSTLEVPASRAELHRNAQEVLTREDSYLKAVNAVLGNPGSAGRSELQTLAANLSSAFTAAGPVVSGESPSVDGTTELVAWAPDAARTIRRRAEQKRRRLEAAARRRAEREARENAPPAPVPATVPRGDDPCGGGVYVNSNTTSCEFAVNVRDAYNAAPGTIASVRAYSPKTGQEYLMHCAPSGGTVTCTGGNNALVTF